MLQILPYTKDSCQYESRLKCYSIMISSLLTIADLTELKIYNCFSRTAFVNYFLTEESKESLEKISEKSVAGVAVRKRKWGHLTSRP